MQQLISENVSQMFWGSGPCRASLPYGSLHYTDWNCGSFHHPVHGLLHVGPVSAWEGCCPLARGDKHLSDTQKTLLVAFYFSHVFWADDG